MRLCCLHYGLCRIVLPVCLSVGVFTWLASCAMRDSAPGGYRVSADAIPDAVPRKVMRSKYGNPASYKVNGKRYSVMQSADGFVEQGIASWYGTKFHGRRTSSGETYNMYEMTAAHKSLPLPTYVEVANLDNGRKTIVKVNDRGPFHEGRIIDLSYAAAIKLDITSTGTGRVKIRSIGVGDTSATSPARLDEVNTAAVDVNGRIFIQVAAFGVENSAVQMVEFLREENFRSVRIYPEDTKGTMLFRVRIGPVPTRKVAQKLLAQLKDINFDNAQIVAK